MNSNTSAIPARLRSNIKYSGTRSDIAKLVHQEKIQKDHIAKQFTNRKKQNNDNSPLDNNNQRNRKSVAFNGIFVFIVLLS